MFKLVLIAFLSYVTIDVGHAAYYDHGVMEQVVRIRQAGWTASPLPEELPNVLGFVAVKDCDRIGQMVALWHGSEGWTFPYLVSDCANKLEKHDLELERKGIVVEVDFNTAARWQVLGLGPEFIDVIVVSKFRGY